MGVGPEGSSAGCSARRCCPCSWVSGSVAELEDERGGPAGRDRADPGRQGQADRRAVVLLNERPTRSAISRPDTLEASSSSRCNGDRGCGICGARTEPTPHRLVERGATSNPVDERPEGGRQRKVRLAIAVVPLTVLLGGTAAFAAGGTTGFGFNAPDIAGAPTGEVAMTGGGAFNPTAGSGTWAFLQLRLPGEPGTARRCWGRVPWRRGARLRVQVHGGDQPGEHQAQTRAAGLLSSRRWERRVLQGDMIVSPSTPDSGRPGCR